MAIAVGADGNQLTRVGTFLNPAADFTIFQWFRWDSPTVLYRVARWLASAPFDYTNPYIYAGTSASGDDDFVVELRNDLGAQDTLDGTDLIIPGDWNWLGIVYRASATEFDIYLNGTLLDTLTLDFSGVSPFAVDHMGDDGGGNTGRMSFAYERMWQAALTSTELDAEAASATMVRTASALSNAPLKTPTSLTDLVGGHDWALDTTALVTDGPFGLGGEMRQLIWGRTHTVHSFLGGNESIVYGILRNPAWNNSFTANSEDGTMHPWSVKGRLTSLRVRLDSQFFASYPGAGITATFTLQVDYRDGSGFVDTLLVATISDLDTVGTSLPGVEVVVVPRCLVRWKWAVSSGNAPQFSVGTHVCATFISDNGYESCYGAGIGKSANFDGVLKASDPARDWACLNSPDASSMYRTKEPYTDQRSAYVDSIVGANGALTRIDKYLLVAPGSGKYWTFLAVLNGVEQDGAGGTVDTRMIIKDAQVEGASLFFLPVTVGQYLQIRAKPTNSPANSHCGGSVAFRATTAGQYIHSVSSINGDPNNFQNWFGATDISTWVAGLTSPRQWVESDVECEMNGDAAIFDQMRARVEKSTTGLGVGNSITLSLRQASASPVGGPTVTMTGLGVFTAQGTGETTFGGVPGERFSIQSDPTGTPAGGHWAWSFRVTDPLADAAPPDDDDEEASEPLGDNLPEWRLDGINLAYQVLKGLKRSDPQ